MPDQPDPNLAAGGILRRPPYVCIDPDEEFRTLDPANRQRAIDLMREAAEDGSFFWLPGDPAPLPSAPYADEPLRPEMSPLRSEWVPLDWVPQDAGIRKGMYVGLGTLIVVILLILLLT